MNTLCPHIFISKSLLKYLPTHFDIINRTLDIFRNRDFSVIANFLGYTEKGPLKNNLSYIEHVHEFIQCQPVGCNQIHLLEGRIAAIINFF